MLFLHEAHDTDFSWHKIPLFEATKGVVTHVLNGDYKLTVSYPITDTNVYQLLEKDKIIVAPVPKQSPQGFRIKDITKTNTRIDVLCEHISYDLFTRKVDSITTSDVTCQTALDMLFQRMSTPNTHFHYFSDVTKKRTFNTKDTQTFYQCLMDGKHSIVGTWETELNRDNFLFELKERIGQDRGVVLTTSKNLVDFEQNESTYSVVTRIHLTSRFKKENEQEETVLTKTIDSPKLTHYPYINEASFENNDIQTVEELEKWGRAKFTNEHIDEPNQKLRIKVCDLDGQVLHLGDTCSLRHTIHNIQLKKQVTAIEYDSLNETYLSFDFDEKGTGVGGGTAQLSNAIEHMVSFIAPQKINVDALAEQQAKNFETVFDEKVKLLKETMEHQDLLSQENVELLKDTIKQELSHKLDEQSQNIQHLSESFELNKQELDTYKEKEVERLKTVKETVFHDLNESFSTVSQALLQRLTDVQTGEEELRTSIRTLEAYKNDDATRTALLKEAIKKDTSAQFSQQLTQLEARIPNDTTIGNIVRTQTSSITQNVSSIQATIQSLNNDVLKKADISITGDKIQFGVGKVVNGTHLASIIAVQPQAITTLTDKFVISPRHENLVKDMYKTDDNHVFNTTGYISDDLPLKVKNGDEFLIHATVVGGSTQNKYIDAKVTYTDNTSQWTGKANVSEFPSTLKIANINDTKTIKHIAFYINGISSSNNLTLKNMEIRQKKSAELIVDGSIQAKHLNTSSVRTGILTAGVINSEMINSNAISARHLNVDLAMFNKIFSNEAHVRTLFAKTVFAKAVQAVDLDATRITTGVLRAKNNWASFDMLTGNMLFNGSATIQFKNADNRLYYTNVNTNAFIRFDDASYNGAMVCVGVNRKGTFNATNGYYTGINIFSYEGAKTVDQIDIYADTIFMSGGYGEVNGFYFDVIRSSFFPRYTGETSLGKSNFPFSYVYTGNVMLSQGGNEYNLVEIIRTINNALRSLGFSGGLYTI
ncbi:hypothetical protein KG091_04425 [Carnobacteriaceae bacterium zg-ZUI78]|nr:hypothetical protein [Carnobacteriaceae bacterium zg-ZUI78]